MMLALSWGIQASHEMPHPIHPVLFEIPYKAILSGLFCITKEVFLTFLQRLIANRNRKLFWIIDRHPVHQAKVVQQWLAEHVDQIEVFELPSYSPQLNPVEYLNGDVKQGVHSKSPSRNLQQLKGRVFSHLCKIQKLPERVLSYFEHPSIAYALQQMHSILLPG